MNTTNFSFMVFSLLDEIKFAKDEFQQMTPMLRLLHDAVRDAQALGESEKTWRILQVVEVAVEDEIKRLCRELS